MSDDALLQQRLAELQQLADLMAESLQHYEAEEDITIASAAAYRAWRAKQEGKA